VNNKKVKCRFCKREILLKDFRKHLQLIHPELVKEKIREVEKVESLDDSSLLLMFTMMEMLREVPPFDSGEIIQEEKFEGKGGEFGGGGASESWEEKCDAKCESCDSHEEESEPDSDNDDSNNDNSNSSNDNE